MLKMEDRLGCRGIFSCGSSSVNLVFIVCSKNNTLNRRILPFPGFGGNDIILNVELRDQLRGVSQIRRGSTDLKKF
jgi:hypothetical protein